jgi:hypothetical protein
MTILRKLAAVIALVSLLLATAQASSLRIQSELIRSGTPVSTLGRVLGSPEHRTVVYDCPNGCGPAYEIWQYRVDNLNFEFDIRAAKVQSVRWSRF